MYNDLGNKPATGHTYLYITICILDFVLSSEDLFALCILDELKNQQDMYNIKQTINPLQFNKPLVLHILEYNLFKFGKYCI